MVAASLETAGPTPNRTQTPERVLDEALALLRDRAREFARLAPTAKAAMLRECIAGIVRVAPAWVAAASRAKGLDPDGPYASEEWFGGPMTTVRNARLLARSLDQIAAQGHPVLPARSFSQSHDGRTQVRVFPGEPTDRALFAGFRVDVRMQPGLGPHEVQEHQAGFYAQRDPEGGVALVLGAGNVASIPPMDALSKMFVEGRTCILKMNPVNDYLGPFLEDALGPLIARGYLRVVYGGAETGSYLAYHPLVTDVHITGSDRTHDAIVWGPPGPERARRISAHDPVLQKPITSELGCVTPVVIVPGEYSPAEMRFVAENVATMVGNNASCNCNAAKMLVTSRRWPQREAFLRAVADVLTATGARQAYYPGARDRYNALLEGRTDVLRVGSASEEALSWALVFGLDPSARGERLFTTEPFTAILSETALPEGDPAEFLAAATRFCNDDLWGTLSASVVIHPAQARDPGTSAALERAIAELRYGTVAINHWPGVVYGLVTPPWGGHPSTTLEDVRSGIGWVHNTFMLDKIEKAVLRGPLTVFPKPPWFLTHRRATEVASRLTDFQAAPSWLKLPAIALAALRA